jgi:hypothetical protein
MGSRALYNEHNVANCREICREFFFEKRFRENLSSRCGTGMVGNGERLIIIKGEKD